jgi:hypothetical protein
MATNPVPDPIEEEAESAFADPVTRQRIERFNARLRRGELPRGRSHNEARRIVGLPPLPEFELNE